MKNRQVDVQAAKFAIIAVCSALVPALVATALLKLEPSYFQLLDWLFH
jgi:hypothetical protein